MPLMHGKSEKAFSQNVRTEMHAGKPQKQALAIAYAEKRRKMAGGGSVDPDEGAGGTCAEHGMASCQTCTMDDDGMPDRPSNVTGGYAEGGMIDRIMAKRWPKESEDMDTEDGEMAHEPDGPSVEDPEPEDEDDDMIGRIMKKRLAGK
jgi:hypothetical protein